ncbi:MULTISPECIES: ATP-binding response regulator [Rhodonellum]|uniref:ATP-binding response regulator n=1 Tax=Rhodonellum TaxID=336827 RepID=UPI0003AB3EE9|nr:MULTISPECIES: ATP-binding protein [Rhodonellum]
MISVSLVTFFSIRNLLDTVENLSEPNEKLRQLNGLMSDVHLLDISREDRLTDKDSVFKKALDRIIARLDWLSQNADETAEMESFDKINHNVRELLVGYAGLEEINNNLSNKNSGQKALKSIETKIQRQRQSIELEFLGKIKERDFFAEHAPKLDQQKPKKANQIENPDLSEKEAKLQGIDDLEAVKQNLVAKGVQKSRADSILIPLKDFVTKIYRDEQQLKGNFANLQASLLEKNKVIFSEIQALITGIQQNLLVDYKEKNQSAYKMTTNVSFILAFLVFLGVIGSLGFVYSILKEVRQANSYRKRLENAKKHSDHLAKAKQDFLANMSHEIRNPLHAIQGFQNALFKTDLNPNQQEFVQMIGFASETLMAIVNDILDFSKLEAGKIHIEKEPFDPKKLFLTIQSFFALKAEEKNLDFNWQIDLQEDKWMVGDQLRINQILNNLISNALKFTHKGSIEVSIVQNSNNTIALVVEDTGMGMNQEVLKKVFQEFNQGDASMTRKFGGTGLGLAIVKRLVDLQHGEIKVESEVGKGTKISLEIPTQFVAPVLKTAQEDSKFTYSLKGLDILVVDDDTIGLKFIRLLLESLGANVVSCLGGVGFRDNFKNRPLDLAILDIQMPEVSGFRVKEMLREIPEYHQLPILAMTANVFVKEKNKLLEEGFDDLLLKPFTESQILKKIGFLLHLTKIPVQQIGKQRNEDIKPYNLEDLRKFCMGDEDLLLEVMTDLVSSTAADLRELEVAMEAKNYSIVREITHQLSSRLGQVRVPSGQKAREIEISIKNNKLDGVDEILNDFISETRIFLELVSQDLNLLVFK